MINVSRRLKVNDSSDAGKAHLTRAQLWEGLVGKARNAVPYVDAITECIIVEDKGEKFIREIVLNNERLQELVTLTEEQSVEFVRLSGSARGVIKNLIEEEAGVLYLRFVFDFSLDDSTGDEQEKVFAQNMEASYLGAVHTTINAIRRRLLEQAEISN
ncbi:SRPBCC family protein [Pseudomonas sp. P39-UII1]|uniref:SRPBCC family protein n=1 Tax=Pseudomonas sp. P39-UII1 TaxID=3080333 RepID=UPI00320B4D0A